MDVVPNFSWALNQLKAGRKVYRQGWNGKGMWLVLLKTDPLYYFQQDTDKYAWQDFIAMKTADGTIVPWTPSQSCILSSDWTWVRDE